MSGDRDTQERAIDASRWLVIRYGVVGLISLVGSTYLIRSVGAAAWAAYSVGYFLVAFAEQALGAGLLGALVRDEQTPSRRRVGTAAALSCLAGVLFAGLLAGVAGPVGGWYGDERLESCLFGVAAAFLLAAIRSPATALLERELRYGWVAAAEVIDNATFLLVAVICLEAGVGFDSLAIALAARNLPAAVLLIAVAGVPLLGRVAPDEARLLLAFALPALGYALFFLLNGLVPALVLGGEHARELAFFMTASSIVGYAAVTQVVVQRVGFPAFSTLRSRPAALTRAVERAAMLSAFVLVAAVLPTAATSPVWLALLFGEDWREAGVVMAWLGAGLVVHGVGGVLTAALNAVGEVRASFYAQAGSTLLYLGLALLLTREVGWLLGAPIALAISRVAAVTYLATRLAGRGLRLGWARQTAWVLAATAAIILIAEAVSRATWALVLAGTAFALWLLLRREMARLAWTLAAPRAAAR